MALPNVGCFLRLSTTLSGRHISIIANWTAPEEVGEGRGGGVEVERSNIFDQCLIEFQNLHELLERELTRVCREFSGKDGGGGGGGGGRGGGVV